MTYLADIDKVSFCLTLPCLASLSLSFLIWKMEELDCYQACYSYHVLSLQVPCRSICSGDSIPALDGAGCVLIPEATACPQPMFASGKSSTERLEMLAKGREHTSMEDAAWRSSRRSCYSSRMEE